MTILNLKQAAKIMHISVEGLRRKAKTGEIPAVKLGKCWVFIEEDLVAYIRSQYLNKEFIFTLKQTKRGKEICHYTGAKAHKYGGSTSQRRAASEYANLLGL